MSYFRRILVAVDASDTSQKAIDLAIHIATDGMTAQVWFCSVVNIDEDYREAAAAELGDIASLIAEDRLVATRTVADAVQAALAAGIEATGEVLEGNPAAEIVKRARDGEFDLIVSGTHGRGGIERLVLGSTAAKILQHASIPVVVAK